MTHLRITLFAGLLATLLAVCPGAGSQAFAGFLTGNDLYSNCKDPNTYKSNMFLALLLHQADRGRGMGV
jgi:hypothetical protein